MLCYLAPLQREFSTLEEVAAAFVPEPTGNNILDNVDPALFDSLGVTMLSHKLALANGAVQLNGVLVPAATIGNTKSTRTT